jgi:hypothetical protein
MRVLICPVSVSAFMHASHLHKIGLWWQSVGGVFTVVTIAWPNNVDWINADEGKRTGNVDRSSKESEEPDEWRLDKWDLVEARNWSTLPLKLFLYLYESSVHLMWLLSCILVHLSRSYASHMHRPWLPWMTACVGLSVFCLFVCVFKAPKPVTKFFIV